MRNFVTLEPTPKYRLGYWQMVWNAQVASRFRRAARGWRGEPFIVLHPGGRIVLDNCEIFGGVDASVRIDEEVSMTRCTFWGAY